ncbi:MAG: hypothetical protein ACK4NF_02825, partial [Planctomycetota bacterium]
KAELGANFSLRREKDFTASLSYNFFKLVDEAANAPDDLGSEVDVKLNWNYNDSLSFAVGAGFLSGSDVLDEVELDGGATTVSDDNASVFFFETRLRF